MKKYLLVILSVFYLQTTMVSAWGQISHGGSPVMNTDDYSASNVLYVLDPEDPVFIEGLKSIKYNSFSKALNYATERAVDLSPDMNGEWIDRQDMSIWRVHLISPDAFSLGVLFSEFELNEDAKLFIYDPKGENIRGSYTSENNKKFGRFFVGHIPGDELIIELQVMNRIRDYGRLRVGLLSHAFLPVYGEKSADDTGLGTSQECEIDINCVEGDDWQTIKRAVCQISTPRLLCTGTLVNNTAYNGKPYIITAEHCINHQANAEGSVFYFGYENSECFVNDASKEWSISGSTMLATGDTLDFTLLELSSMPPREFNVYYAGWDVQEQNHVAPVALHHPNADAMKISKDFNTTLSATSLPGDLNDYIVESNFRIQQWDLGTTEGGSSGCPLFSSKWRIIGILSGGQAFCGEKIGYDSDNDRIIYSLDDNVNDYFSKLSFDWEYHKESNKQLKKWLDPINSGQKVIGGLAVNSLGVSKNTLNVDILTVYPNPSDGDIRINLPEYNGKLLNVSIYDLTGSLHYISTERSVYPLQISLPEIPAGIYMIKVSSDRTNYSGRIILN
ncbi:MAG: T9SS type A sorting domain-containing protein [Bacteroidales bacterium]|nr:T9SS type A sorting domain-containing protein [Bacteroidales bacterium]